jgi:type VI secretion system secreted protein VgrG
VARLTQGRDLHEGLSQAAQQAKAHEAGDQDDVTKALKDQNDAIRGGGGDRAQGQFPEFQQPHLTLASPAGIQTAAKGSTHIASLGHNAFTSGAHTSVSAGKSLLVSAKDAVRMFAYKAGIRLIAGNADIDIQALKTSINILGKLNIKLEAERITITAKEEVLINGGSSFSRWNAQGIVHGTNGLWREHAATHSLVGPASRNPEMMNRDVKAPFDQEVVFHHLDDKNTLAAKQVFKLLRDGETPPPPEPAASSGATTSTDGTTQLQRSDGPEIYRVRWLGKKK